ncbi:MAG: hypothetical protein QW505_04115 [Thermoplasmata archaeon]
MKPWLARCLPMMIAFLMFMSASSPLATAAGNDLIVDSADIVQVVVNPDILVANKSAAMRVFITNTFLDRIYVDILVIYDFGKSSYLEQGPDGTGVPLNPGMNFVYLPGGGCPAHPEPWPTNLTALKWTSQGLDSSATVKIDPANEVIESDESNNAITIADPLHVVDTRGLRILVQPMYNTRAAYLYPFSFSLEEEIQQFVDVYPIADDGLTVVEAPPKWVSFSESPNADFDQLAALTKELSPEARMLGYDKVIAVFRSAIFDDRLFGITREVYGSAVGCLDEPRDPVPIYITGRGLDLREFLLAHEVGHTYYLWHPHDSLGLHVYNATKWSVREKVYGTSANTMMSYPERSSLPSGVPTTPRWIDRQRYEDYPRSYIDLSSYGMEIRGTWQWNLVDQFAYVPPPIDRVIVVQMTFHKSGGVTIPKPWFRVPLGTPDESPPSQYYPPGNYSVRMLDASLNELGRTYFNVSFKKLTHSDELEDFISTKDVESVDVVLNVRDYPNTKYVRVVDSSETILAERTVSASAPNVTLLSPNGFWEYIGESCEIAWNGSDADGDNLTYMLAYSEDDGDTWIPIASGLTNETYLWNTTGVAPTKKCRVKVIASDGINTAEDVSDEAIEMRDWLAPVTSIEINGTLGNNGWYVSAVNVTLRATDNSRIRVTEYTINSENWTEYRDAFVVGQEGTNIIKYASTDLAWNQEEVKTVEIKIDRTAPFLMIALPTNGSVIAGPEVEIYWIAKDEISGLEQIITSLNKKEQPQEEGLQQVAEYKVVLGPVNWTDFSSGNCLSDPEYAHSKYSNLSPGLYVYELRAIDVAGHQTATKVEFIYAGNGAIPLELLLVFFGAVVAVVAVLIGLYLKRKNAMQNKRENNDHAP